MAKLVCQAGPNAGHEYPLNKDKVLFGRQRTCDVQIMDSMASREHFLVRKDGSLFTVVDLESRNGTHLNNRKVTERQLDFGDVLRVGSVEYLFVKEEGDADIKDLLTKKYTILEKIGEGGMGIVYKPQQKSMERTVALKILAPKYTARPRFVEQFIREARAAGALNHPNIIQVHDVASENGVHYFSMEFIDGPTANRMLASEGPLPPAAALEIVRQTAKALAYAHDHRLIHRDIKPDNIMVTTNNTVKLADLGISKTFDEAEAEGKPKRIVGTPHYMAPEASMGNRIDHRVDIYSLGVTFYQLLSGSTPFSGSKATDVLKAHIKEEAPKLSTLVPAIPAEIEALVEKMMAKDPDNRYASAELVASEAQTILQNLASGSGANKGQETVMLRRMVSATASAPETGGAPSHPSQATGQTAHKLASATQSSEQQFKQAKMLRLAINLGVALLVIILGLVLFSQLRNTIVDDTGPEREEAVSNDRNDNQPDSPPDTETEANPATTDTGEQTPDTTDRDNLDAQVDEFSVRLAQANSAAELAALIEELRQFQGQIDDPDLQSRRQRMEDTAATRLQAILQNEENQRFSALESEIDQLVEDAQFASARERLQAFQAEHNERLNDRKADLLNKINQAHERYMGNLERRMSRHIISRDIAALRELRDSIPEALLDEPLAKELNSKLRELESARLENQRAILKQAQKNLLAMNIEEMQLYIKQQQERSKDTQLNQQLQELGQLGDRLSSAITTLKEGLAETNRPPRYRGTLHGIDSPDILDLSASGLLLKVHSGGQATVPWRDIDPALLPELVTFLMSETGIENKDLDQAFSQWLDAVADARK